MRHDLRDKVVVITGASSGIGRATALAFAEQGAHVVLAARRDDVLEQVRQECQRKGPRAIAVQCDVVEPAEVQGVADEAVNAFGRIDVWINNAGILALGKFEDTPPDIVEQVMRVNYYGTVQGCRSALRQFRVQGHGTIVNVASIASFANHAYAAAYSASKAAVRAFTEALRQELLDQPNIRISTVLPAAIDTPLFQHAANYAGRQAKALDPVYAPEEVAAAIVAMAQAPKREVIVGRAGKLMNAEFNLAPGLAAKLTAKMIERGMFQDESAGPTTGNAFEPMFEGQDVSGGWRERNRKLKAERWQRRRPQMTLGGIALLALGLGLVAGRVRGGPQRERIQGQTATDHRIDHAQEDRRYNDRHRYQYARQGYPEVYPAER
ncbi:MAG TPA: SDR family oxidoreductase [Alphaproteobacteria bacterium]|nr:SDR family oxidoreductase [Alphaproteobacteria bacterium]